MSKKHHTAPLALASDGTILINVAEFDGSRTLPALLQRAQKQRGAVFIGVQLNDREAWDVLLPLSESCTEVAAHLAGSRQKK